MNIFVKVKERFIIKKEYNINLLRCLLLLLFVAQIFFVVIPMLIQQPRLEQISNLIYVIISSLLTYILGYVMEILLFYVVFRNHVNSSIRTAEKQIVPLLLLKMIIPFVVNLIGVFVLIPNYNIEIKIIQYAISFFYIGYLVMGNVFKEKCILNMVIYFMILVLIEVVAHM